MDSTEEAGFTLLELLIVAALIGILAAIATPGLLRAKMTANEGSAIRSLRSIGSAQATFASSCGGGFFASSLTLLSTPPTAGGDGFIGPDFSNDPTTKTGYVFTLTPGAAGAASPPSCNGAAAGSLVYTYFVGASPTPATGERHFGVNQGGTIYQSPNPVAVTQIGAPAGATPLE